MTSLNGISVEIPETPVTNLEHVRGRKSSISGVKALVFGSAVLLLGYGYYRVVRSALRRSPVEENIDHGESLDLLRGRFVQAVKDCKNFITVNGKSNIGAEQVSKNVEQVSSTFKKVMEGYIRVLETDPKIGGDISLLLDNAKDLKKSAANVLKRIVQTWEIYCKTIPSTEAPYVYANKKFELVAKEHEQHPSKILGEYIDSLKKIEEVLWGSLVDNTHDQGSEIS